MLHRTLLTSAFLLTAACATDDGANAGSADAPASAPAPSDDDEDASSFASPPSDGEASPDAKASVLDALSFEQQIELRRASDVEATADPHAYVFNRVITLLANPGDGDDAIRAAAKAATGVEVASLSRLSVRGGEKVYVLVTFAPASPPRGASEQAALVEQLRASEAFAAADPDKIMTMKAD